MRSWLSWLKVYRVCWLWVTIETRTSQHSLRPPYRTSSSAWPGFPLWTATHESHHWWESDWVCIHTLCAGMIKTVWKYSCVWVNRSGSWAGPPGRVEILARHCQRSLWSSCRRKMSSESSSTALTLWVWHERLFSELFVYFKSSLEMGFWVTLQNLGGRCRGKIKCVHYRSKVWTLWKTLLCLMFKKNNIII